MNSTVPRSLRRPGVSITIGPERDDRPSRFASLMPDGFALTRREGVPQRGRPPMRMSTMPSAPIASGKELDRQNVAPCFLQALSLDFSSTNANCAPMVRYVRSLNPRPRAPLSSTAILHSSGGDEEQQEDVTDALMLPHGTFGGRFTRDVLPQRYMAYLDVSELLADESGAGSNNRRRPSIYPARLERARRAYVPFRLVVASP